MQAYQHLIRDVPDFPKPGIIFKDITPLLLDPAAFSAAIKAMASPFQHQSIDVVLGMESRGFMFAPAIALELGCGFAPVRKPGKLPCPIVSESYALEYGTDSLELHRDAIGSGQKVLIVDDVIATGGTAAATERMVQSLGGSIVGFCFLIELSFLDGRSKLKNQDITAIWKY